MPACSYNVAVTEEDDTGGGRAGEGKNVKEEENKIEKKIRKWCATQHRAIHIAVDMARAHREPKKSKARAEDKTKQTENKRGAQYGAHVSDTGYRDGYKCTCPAFRFVFFFSLFFARLLFFPFRQPPDYTRF